MSDAENLTGSPISATDGDVSRTIPIFLVEKCVVLFLWCRIRSLDWLNPQLSDILSDLHRGEGPITSMKTTFIKARRRLAAELQNPRPTKISFHTFRHWKAATLYHQTKDPYHVKDFLGHKSLKNTEIYIIIERSIFEPTSEDWTVKVAQQADEVKSLLEVSFEYVCHKDNLIFLKKR